MNRVVVILSVLIAAVPAHAQLRGHGGPVRGVAISADGSEALSGSFDSSAIRWSRAHNSAREVLRFHADAVNAVALLRDGRAVTAGADGKIAIWRAGAARPGPVLEGHTAPIVALSVSPDGAWLASAAWDRTVRIWPLAGGAPRVLEGHTQNVNGVTFSPDGNAVISAGYDGTIRIWEIAGDGVSVHNIPSPLNSVVSAADGDIIAAGASGKVFFLSAAGELL